MGENDLQRRNWVPAAVIAARCAAITDTLLVPGSSATTLWVPRCFIRRTAWHVLGHA